MVYIVLVNWNGWRHTLECLESVFRLKEVSYTVVVCDNASEDESVEKIRLWSQGKLLAQAADWRYESRLGPPVPKPIRCVEWRPGDDKVGLDNARLVLIPGDANLGFAAGCNVGIRFSLDRIDTEFVWLLNNDTVVEPDSLTALIAKMRREPNVGLCGSTVCYYSEPEIVQCYGGYGFNEWTARVLPITKGHSRSLPSEADIEARIKYISGASTLVRRDFLENVGLLNPQYFLYFEEIDWATRGRGIYSLGYCRESVVFHKEGRAIGSNRSSKKRSVFSEAHLSRNRVLFTRTYFPGRIPFVMAWVTLVSLQRMLTGNYILGRTMLVSAWKGLFQQPQPASNYVSS
jgi:GT2 family glycosyltransferase